MKLTKQKILLVEDDLSFVHLITSFLERKGFDVTVAHTVKNGIELIQAETFNLLLLDFNLPDGNAFDLISTAATQNIKLPIVIMTSFNDIKTAVRAMQLGVKNYITKPIHHEELLMIVTESLQTQINAPDKNISTNSEFIVGKSASALQVQKHLELVAPTEMSVIIQGESGTGKEHIARSIHYKSKRAQAKFVAIDCGALSDELASSELFGHVKGSFTGALSDKKGEFEVADGGTLFLDEIGNLSYNVQVKLLRAIQERVIQPVGSNKTIKIDVRIIVATNDDLKQSITKSSFREDLYHRLNEFLITLPALRDRPEDLSEFVAYFIKHSNTELGKNVKGVSKEVMNVFEKYKWPGNLRELKNIIKRAVLLSSSEIITPSELPADMISQQESVQLDSGNTLKEINEANEKKLIVKVLQEVKFNKTKAAATLQIDRKTLYLKMARYGIEG